MNFWVRSFVWAVMVGLQLYVARAFSGAFCGVGQVDPGGPILLVHVSESDIWVHALLMLSVLVLIPLGLRVCSETNGSREQWVEVISACLLGLSLTVRPCDPRVIFDSDPLIRRVVPLGFLLSLPWLLVRLRVAAVVARHWFRSGLPSCEILCLQSASIFPAIGAAWLVVNRSNWTPWGFDPLIVLLTAAHFHHAGFTLPLMAGLNAKASPGKLTKFSCVAILAGVPLVAAGITCTHFGVLRVVEPLGVMILVLGALGVATLQVLRGIEFRSGLNTWTRIGFVVSGASLLTAMLLALGFGLRFVIPEWALTMPQMWAIHGTLNAFGFGLCGILAWRSDRRQV